MPSVREGVQPELQPHHTQQETHRIQTVRLRPLRQRFPEEGGPEEAQRDATRPKMKRNFISFKPSASAEDISWNKSHFYSCSARVCCTGSSLLIYLNKNGGRKNYRGELFWSFNLATLIMSRLKSRRTVRARRERARPASVGIQLPTFTHLK